MIHIRNLDKKQKYIVGLSAGVDSVSCLHLLWRLGYNVSAAHFNHNYSPGLNAKMEASARQFCLDHKIPIYFGYNTERFDGGNLEARFRVKRLEFFKKLGGDIVLAHHLNDCIENATVLRLQNKGDYCPIPTKTKLEGTNFNLIRPFMLSTKKDFEEYAAHNSLEQYIIEDASNYDISFRRNYLRHKLLPMIPESLGLYTSVKKQMEYFYKKDKETL